MKELKLTKGFVALVDDEDFDMLILTKWYFQANGYAYGYHKGKRAKMHRVIMNVTNPMELIDHINGNKLDNRKENLRITDAKGNSRNKVKSRKNKSGYKGVSLCKTTQKYRADIWANNIRYNLGRYSTIKEAAIAYNDAALKYFGEFACLNDV